MPQNFLILVFRLPEPRHIARISYDRANVLIWDTRVREEYHLPSLQAVKNLQCCSRIRLVYVTISCLCSDKDDIG